jgi:hypothetical protein
MTRSTSFPSLYAAPGALGRAAGKPPGPDFSPTLFVVVMVTLMASPFRRLTLVLFVVDVVTVAAAFTRLYGTAVAGCGGHPG